MGDLLTRLSNPDSIMLLIFGGAILFGLVAIAGSIAIKIVKSNNETRLKQEMLARGMSADEIRAVLEAGTKPPAIKIAWKKQFP
ncbi:MAG TPA: hypothetical protein VMJ32_03580 [Pirellulales bacterium]|nr:hypothetical protein [Pirellulales bacterium]